MKFATMMSLGLACLMSATTIAEDAAKTNEMSIVEVAAEGGDAEADRPEGRGG